MPHVFVEKYLCSHYSARWRIRVCSVSKKPEFGRTAYSGPFGVRAFFRKKKLLKNDSISDIIMQRRTYSNHSEKIWTKIWYFFPCRKKMILTERKLDLFRKARIRAKTRIRHLDHRPKPIFTPSILHSTKPNLWPNRWPIVVPNLQSILLLNSVLW